MKDKNVEIQKGIKLHVINTNNFKTNLIAVFITIPLSRKDITKNALIPAVLMRGNQKLKTQEEISKKLEELYGAGFNCGIDKTGDNHVMKFYLEALNDNYIQNKENILETSINTLLEIILNPLIENEGFKEEYIEGEKNKLRQIIESKIDNKDSYAIVRCTEEVYKGEVYGLYKYGYIEDLEKINQKNLYEYYKELLNTCKIDIFVSGEFEGDEVEKIVRNNKNIKKLNAREPKYIVNRETTEKKSPKEVKKVEEKMDVTQGKLIMALDIICNEEDSRFASVLYNTILGDSANSKLFQNVREKEHLAYSARSIYVRPKNNIFIRCGIEIDNYEKAVDIIEKQIEDMKKGEFTSEDIESSKKYIISSVKGIEEEQDTEITYYLGQELSNCNYTPEQYMQKISEVKKEDIEKIANGIQLNTIYFLRN